MKNEEEELEQIERYIAHQMSEDEKKSFEELLESNIELRTNFEGFSETIEAIEDYNIKEELKDIHFEVVTKKRKKKSQTFFYISSIAASLIIILVSAYFLYFNAPSPSDVYISYFEPYPELGTSRGQADFNKAYKQYVLGKYENAIQMLNALPREGKFKDSIIFYTAISHMMLGNISQAIEALETLPEKNEFEHQTKWYLGLAYLQQNNKEKAVEYLLKIDKEEYKYKEARDIIALFQ